MGRSTPILLAMLILLPNLAFGEDRGFYFGAGLSARFLDGDAYYKTTVTQPPIIGADPEPTVFSGKFDITDNIGYFLNSKSFLGLRPTIGYRISDRFGLSASYDLLYSIDGNRVPWSLRVNPGVTEAGVIDSSKFSQKTLQILARYYPGIWNLFVAAGAEYSTLRLEMTFHTVARGNLGIEYMAHYYEDDDYVWGWVLGIGTERPLRGKMTLVAMTTYSSARYSGDGMYFGASMDEYELDVGGVSAQLSIQYYIM